MNSWYKLATGKQVNVYAIHMYLVLKTCLLDRILESDY